MQERSEMEDLGKINYFCTEHGLLQQNSIEEQSPFISQAQPKQNTQHQLPSSDTDLNVRSLPTDQRIQEIRNIRELTEKFLCGHSSQFNSPGEKDARNLNSNGKPPVTVAAIQKLFTEKIMRLAGERFIEFSSQKFININLLVHPYGSALSHLTSEEKQDVELAQLLLAAAEKVSCQQYDRASKLLTQCELTASSTGTPSQRTVFHFSEALRERIDRETGRSSSPILTEEEAGNHDVACSKLRFSIAFLAWHKEIPFTQVMHFTAVQSILENIETNTKIHVIDLHLRSGLQWAVLMQALADDRALLPIKHLKLTAIETADQEKVEETGKNLQTFARSLGLNFSFKVVFLSDIEDLKVEQFRILPRDEDETIVVYASMVLRTMLSNPIHVETVMRVLKNLNPTVMVVAEVEANHNSPCFINRFVDALFYYATLFDCLEDNLERGNRHRTAIETIAFREGIRNIVATEGRERTTRSVKIDVWRSFFAKFGMAEIPLSQSCLYQANLILQQFHCGSSCTLEMNGGGCILLGWKGTPVHSISSWKFQ